jgi:hypothetical protein
LQSPGNGFVTYELSGRLLRAQLALAHGCFANATGLAMDLGAEARAKGFGLIAQRCGKVIAEAKSISLGSLSGSFVPAPALWRTSAVEGPTLHLTRRSR